MKKTKIINLVLVAGILATGTACRNRRIIHDMNPSRLNMRGDNNSYYSSMGSNYGGGYGGYYHVAPYYYNHGGKTYRGYDSHGFSNAAFQGGSSSVRRSGFGGSASSHTSSASTGGGHAGSVSGT